jgi:hypothetical protein
MPESSFICSSHDITNEINQKILERNFAYGYLDVLLSPRSQPTKYVKPYAVADPLCSPKIFHYNTTKTFNPGDKGSWSGYVTNINNESILRNQIYALQKFPQSDFVPGSNSDLYNSTIPNINNNNVEMLFPNLFNSNIVSSELKSEKNDKTPHNLGNLFNNHTRQQLKDS